MPATKTARASCDASQVKGRLATHDCNDMLRFYTEVRNRAVELLQSGSIDDRTVDQLRNTERCNRNYYIGIALIRARDEIQRREQSWVPANRRRNLFPNGSHRKAANEIAKLTMKSKARRYEP